MPKGHFIRTGAHRKAIADALRGKRKSAEHNQHNSEAQKQRVPMSPETIEKHRQRMLASNPMRGKSLSDEHRRKLSEAKKGKSTTVRRYGLDPEEYTRQIAAGNRWCCYKKHFAPAEGFSSKQGVCSGCKSEFYRESDLKRKYGITHEWYLAKLAEQGGVCALCKRAELSKGDTNFAVDHDHETGKNRGLLCGLCNQALGAIERIPNWFMAVSLYLARYR